jgi:serine/threonine protein kinase
LGKAPKGVCFTVTIDHISYFDPFTVKRPHITRGILGDTTIFLKVLGDIECHCVDILQSHSHSREYYGFADHVVWMNDLPIAISYCHGVGLDTVIMNYSAMSKLSATSAAVQILYALYALHRRFRISHRDIKADNIVVDMETKAVKIIDFGEASTEDVDQEGFQVGRKEDTQAVKKLVLRLLQREPFYQEKVSVITQWASVKRRSLVHIVKDVVAKGWVQDIYNLTTS